MNKMIPAFLQVGNSHAEGYQPQGLFSWENRCFPIFSPSWHWHLVRTQPFLCTSVAEISFTSFTHVDFSTNIKRTHHSMSLPFIIGLWSCWGFFPNTWKISDLFIVSWSLMAFRICQTNLWREKAHKCQVQLFMPLVTKEAGGHLLLNICVAP